MTSFNYAPPDSVWVIPEVGGAGPNDVIYTHKNVDVVSETSERRLTA